MIRVLRDLRAGGTAEERKWVNQFVASFLELRAQGPDDPQWDRAWRLAQNEWEKEVKRFRDRVPEEGEAEHERRAMEQLARKMYARLEQLGYRLP